ncbi:hypothetical protein GC194_14965 [bacterium]|nr:hypothetical protein [bacterium]
MKRKEGWERGELTGNQYQFYENGAKRIVQECKADKNRCEYKLFSENGELEISGFYQNSKRDGIWFSRNGFTAKNGKQQETYDLYEYFESGIGFNISAAFWKRKPTSELIVKFPSGCKKFQFSQSEMKVLDIEDCECNDNFITP